ncbi:MAG TPA: metal/formaldehyde-sensitive transcriptional repressor [Variovorax sp.]|nr:metal/formaldehyde-sensitive transcriptional repressor [Variovorax sp.]
MAHTSLNKKPLLARVRRIAGQVAALEKALAEESPCADVLIQIAAAKGAMHALMMEVLVGHLDEHVVAEPDQAQREAEARVLTALLKNYGK